MQNPRRRKRKKFARTGWCGRYKRIASYTIIHPSEKNGGTFAITSPAVEQYWEYVQGDLQDSDRLGAAKPRGKSRRRFDPQCNIVRLPADQGIDVCWINVSLPGLCDATVKKALTEQNIPGLQNMWLVCRCSSRRKWHPRDYVFRHVRTVRRCSIEHPGRDYWLIAGHVRQRESTQRM